MSSRDIEKGEVRRKLLKLGVYSVPAIFFAGKVSYAKPSGGCHTRRKHRHEKKKHK